MKNLHVVCEDIYMQKGVTVIKLSGTLDIIGADAFEQVLDSILKSAYYCIVVDLEKVDYVSSAGWRVIISRLKEIRDHRGDLKVANMHPDVHEVFDLLEFFTFLKACETVEDAISDFGDLVDDTKDETKSIPFRKEINM